MLTGLLLLLAPCALPPAAWAVEWIEVQQGYHPQAPKRIIIRDVPAVSTTPLAVRIFDPTIQDMVGVIMNTKGKIVADAQIVAALPQTDEPGPPLQTLVVDFTPWEKPGKIELVLEGLDSGPIHHEVTLSSFIYWDPLQSIARTFYYNRSGITLEDKLTGLYMYPGHVNDADLLSEDLLTLSTFRDVTGGWYHQGDSMAKYTTATALAASSLMDAYSWNPKAFEKFVLNYPYTEERPSRLPEILHETRIGLDWVLSMQRPDGGFYRKVDGIHPLGPKTLPAEDTQDRYLFEVTSQDTAVATAVLAQAARVYRDVDLQYAIKCLLHAQRGWKFLTATGSVGKTFYIAPENLSDKTYLNTEGDEAYRIWAATELYLATGKAGYRDIAVASLSTSPFGAAPTAKPVPVEFPTWKNPLTKGLSHVVFAEINRPQTTQFTTDNPDVLITSEDPLFQLARHHLVKLAYQLVTQHPTPSRLVYADSFLLPWQQSGTGDTQSILTQMQILSFGFHFQQEEVYRTAVQERFNTLFGLNPWSRAFITRQADDVYLSDTLHPVQYPCHKITLGTGKMLSGWMISGPVRAQSPSKKPLNNTGIWQGLRYEDKPETACQMNRTGIIPQAEAMAALSALNALYNTQRYNPMTEQADPSGNGGGQVFPKIF